MGKCRKCKEYEIREKTKFICDSDSIYKLRCTMYIRIYSEHDNPGYDT
jgi:hypothetical protein